MTLQKHGRYPDSFPLMAPSQKPGGSQWLASVHRLGIAINVWHVELTVAGLFRIPTGFPFDAQRCGEPNRDANHVSRRKVTTMFCHGKFNYGNFSAISHKLWKFFRNQS